MDKTVYVPASFKEIRESRTIQVPSGKRGFLGHERTIVEQRWVTGGYSDCEIDGQRLQRDVQLVVDELNEEGYDIVSLVPVESGMYNWSPEGYSYGYSYRREFRSGPEIDLIRSTRNCLLMRIALCVVIDVSLNGE